MYLCAEICYRFPDGARVILDVLESDRLLPSPSIETVNTGQNSFNRVINSPIVSVIIGNQENSDLEEPIRIVFTPLEVRPWRNLYQYGK